MRLKQNRPLENRKNHFRTSKDTRWTSDESETNKAFGRYWINHTTVLLDTLDKNVVYKTGKQIIVKLVENERKCISIGQC